MTQQRVHGAVSSDQFLSATLDWFIIDTQDANAANGNVAAFGYSSGNALVGEQVIAAFSTIANPVVIQSGSARLLYVATEVPGVTAAAAQVAVRAGISATCNTTITVTAGTLSIV